MINNFNIVDFLSKQIEQLKIVVIGDVMLDSYYYGSVSRISPEAPVPVNKVNNQSENLGGAANVAANLAFLGCKVYLCSAIGDDENGKKLTSVLDSLSIDHSSILVSENRQTTNKLRIIGSNQQMLRLDFEDIQNLTDNEEDELFARLRKLMSEGVNGIVISDYAKGVCTKSFCQKVITQAKAANIPVLVDPKGYNWDKYENVDFITPNVKELGECLQQSLQNTTPIITKAAREALDKYKVKSILVTRSEQGMTFVDKDKEFTVEATAREVYDVSGAGDTVAAAFIAGVSGGLTEATAAFLANEAAAIVVARAGTYAIRRDELLAHLLEKECKTDEKHRPLNWQEIKVLAQSWRRLGKKIIFTNGCFDILHTGHITYLEKAAKLGDILILGLNSDASVRRLKGETRPLVGEQDRARLLLALSCIDAVVLFEEDTPTELIKIIKPDVLVKGGDYSAEQVAGREYAGKVEIIDFEQGYSTTDLVNKIIALVKGGKL